MRGRNNMNNLMKQAQKMQAKMAKIQEELGEKTVEVTAGGGMIKVVATGHKKVQSIEIDPDVIDPDDADMLQDLILAAVNEALDKADAMAQEALGSIAGGMNMPGLF